MFIDLVYARDIKNGSARLYQAPAFNAFLTEGKKVVAENDRTKVLEIITSCTIEKDREREKYEMMVLLNGNRDIPRIVGRIEDITYEEGEEDEHF